MMDDYMAYIHWDADHCSPPIGPFHGITAAKRWARDWRRVWREHTTKPPPRITFKVVATPDRANSWLYHDRGWEQDQ